MQASEELVKNFTRIELEKYRRSEHNVIVLPKHFNTQLEIITHHTQEVLGVALAIEHESDTPFSTYIIEGILLLGMGSAYSVFPDEKRLIIANEILKFNPLYRAIEFHTHCKGTGEMWYDKFSSGDFNSFNNILSYNRYYKHILFTPTNILTFGEQRCDIVIPMKGDNDDKVKDRQRIIMTDFNERLKKLIN